MPPYSPASTVERIHARISGGSVIVILRELTDWTP
jgi:hypothetical protein